jgi:diphosphomevalonate decarboxylase
VSQKVVVIAPSNIALVKYWGKADPKNQWPENDSLSLTLERCHTETTASLRLKHDNIIFDGELLSVRHPAASRMIKLLDRIRENAGEPLYFEISTKNSFPTGAGIASSASGFAALGLAAVGAVTQSIDIDVLHQWVGGKSSFEQLIRLGSGSACRSLYGGLVQWNKGSSPANQSVQQHDLAVTESLRDIVVIINSSAKKHSSSHGHSLAPSSLFHQMRVAESSRRIERLLNVINAQDFAALADIVESEAMEMHASMQTCSTPLEYFGKKTAEFISSFRKARHAKQWPAAFTLDAGSNVHLICHCHCEEQIITWIKNFHNEHRFITDKIGKGPKVNFL